MFYIYLVICLTEKSPIFPFLKILSWRNSILGRTLSWHMADPNFISNIPYGPLRTFRSNSSVQESGVTPEHHGVYLKNKTKLIKIHQ